MSRKQLPLTQFYRFENSLYLIKHDSKVNIFYSDIYFYISQEHFSKRVSLLTSLMKKFILLRYITRYPTLQIQYLKILSQESILLAKIKEYTILYILDKFQGVCMTIIFHMSVF